MEGRRCDKKVNGDKGRKRRRGREEAGEGHLARRFYNWISLESNISNAEAPQSRPYILDRV